MVRLRGYSASGWVRTDPDALKASDGPFIGGCEEVSRAAACRGASYLETKATQNIARDAYGRMRCSNRSAISRYVASIVIQLLRVTPSLQAAA